MAAHRQCCARQSAHQLLRKTLRPKNQTNFDTMDAIFKPYKLKHTNPTTLVCVLLCVCGPSPAAVSERQILRSTSLRTDASSRHTPGSNQSICRTATSSSRTRAYWLWENRTPSSCCFIEFGERRFVLLPSSCCCWYSFENEKWITLNCNITRTIGWSLSRTHGISAKDLTESRKRRRNPFAVAESEFYRFLLTRKLLLFKCC